MGKKKRLLAVPIVVIALSLVFIINGTFFTYPQETTPTNPNTNNAGPNTIPDDFFHVPEVPGTLIPLVLGFAALLLLYWKK